MHKLVINKKGKDIKIKLDNFELKNVSKYLIVSSADGMSELTIKLLVNDSKIEI